MKQLLAIVLFLMMAPALRAQRWEIQPTIGLGMTNTLVNPIAPKSKPIAAYHAGLSFIAHFEDFQLLTGVSYLTSGYSISGEFFLNGLSSSLVSGTKHARFAHIGIPVLAGNRFQVGKRMHLNSFVGLIPVYNLDFRFALKTANEKFDYTYADPEFEQEYHRFALFGVVQSRLEITCSKTLNVFVGSAFRAIVTDIRKAGPVSQEPEHEYTLTAEAGMGIYLKHP